MFTGLDRNPHEKLNYKKKNMFVFTILCVCSFMYISADPQYSYDQRQTGELNVQIDLKNLNILALMKGGKEEYVDYDYAYDYSEMTIKPTNGTTPKPLNTTTVTIEKDNTTNSTPVTLLQTTESIVKTSTNPTEAGLTQTDSTNKTKPASDATTKPTLEVTSTLVPDTTHIANTTVQTVKNCRRGFVRNGEGKCEYKVHGTSNALRRIVKLAQKIKIGRSYQGHPEDIN